MAALEVRRAGKHPKTLLLLAAALFAALGALALAINLPSLLDADTAVADFFAPERTGRRIIEADRLFGFIGKPIHVLIPAVILGGFFSLRARSVVPFLAVTGAVGAGVILEQTLKAVIGRTPATPELVDYAHSFPSGHVTGTAALLGMVAVCLGTGRGRAVRVTLAVAVVAAVVFVAVLALYTGAHLLTDVLGGMLLGGAIVSLGAAILAVFTPPVPRG